MRKVRRWCDWYGDMFQSQRGIPQARDIIYIEGMHTRFFNWFMKFFFHAVVNRVVGHQMAGCSLLSQTFLFRSSIQMHAGRWKGLENERKREREKNKNLIENKPNAKKWEWSKFQPQYIYKNNLKVLQILGILLYTPICIASRYTVSSPSLSLFSFYRVWRRNNTTNYTLQRVPAHSMQ